MPAELQEALTHAKEVTLCVTRGQVEEGLSLIERHVSAAWNVQVLWAWSDLSLLERLLRQGYRVFDAPVSGQDRLFAGDNLGYTLPDFMPISNARETVLMASGRRIGTYLLFSGEVGGVFPEHQLFKLKDRDLLFISVATSKLTLPQLGCQVEVVSNCPWASARVVVASAERIHITTPASSMA